MPNLEELEKNRKKYESFIIEETTAKKTLTVLAEDAIENNCSCQICRNLRVMLTNSLKQEIGLKNATKSNDLNP
jgi:hypothetical protein